MNIEVRQPLFGAKESVKDSGKVRVGIFDCDIHPKSSLEDLRPYLSNRWWDYLQTYGQRQRHGCNLNVDLLHRPSDSAKIGK